MDLRAYYEKIKSFEQQIVQPFVSVVLKGQSGPATEVSKTVAAKLLADEKATLAQAAETLVGDAIDAAATKLSAIPTAASTPAAPAPANKS